MSHELKPTRNAIGHSYKRCASLSQRKCCSWQQMTKSGEQVQPQRLNRLDLLLLGETGQYIDMSDCVTVIKVSTRQQDSFMWRMSAGSQWSKILPPPLPSCPLSTTADFPDKLCLGVKARRTLVSVCRVTMHMLWEPGQYCMWRSAGAAGTRVGEEREGARIRHDYGWGTMRLSATSPPKIWISAGKNL